MGSNKTNLICVILIIFSLIACKGGGSGSNALLVGECAGGADLKSPYKDFISFTDNCKATFESCNMSGTYYFGDSEFFTGKTLFFNLDQNSQAQLGCELPTGHECGAGTELADLICGETKE